MAKNTTNQPAKSKIAKKSVPVLPTVPVSLWSRLKTFLALNTSAKSYAYLSVLVLVGTTLLWAILGAKLQNSNADQLANSYLFQDSNTTQGATLPGAHSFLIKWPLFYLIKLFGYSSASFIAVTVLSVLATVAVLVFVLYRIERRPLVFGTICLALASVLLLVPAQPYAGGLLPVNMAMLATRNLEYAVYILAIMLFVRSAGVRNRWFWLTIAALGLLIASDKLFLGISVIGALVGLFVYALKRRWDAVSLSSNWLAVSLIGALLGIVLLILINASGFTHISSQSSSTPYTLVSSSKGLGLGILYAVMGLLTNFGANPAYDATVVHNIPHQLVSRIFSLDGPAYIINLVIFGLGLFCMYHLIRSSLAARKSVRIVLDKYTSLALMLVFSSVAAFGLFIASDHYYAVDARYLTIAVFSLFICGALFTRNRNWASKNITISGLVILAGIIFGIIFSVRTYNYQSQALANINTRNSLVAQALAHHPVSALVGDYWRVVPTKLAAGSDLKVMPLSSCFVARDALSSKAWQEDLKNHSFAYLLSLDRSLTDYQGCTLSQVINRYGRPNTSVLISGSLSRPKELVLFYDRGIHKSAPKVVLKTPSTVLPITLDELPYTTCPVPTVMNIVAHQDDDLLFMNPDILNDIKAGHCVRTIYVTAGDAGSSGQFYWLSRQQGSEAAYSKMIGTDDIWIDRIVKITDQEYVTIANPRGDSKVSLIFLHLPDGGTKGGGFPANRNESLAKLESGSIKNMQSVDKQSVFSLDELNALITSLMHTYQPGEIRAQANYAGQRFTDHSDHMAVGRLVAKSYSQYEKQQFEGTVTIPIRYYIGYPVHELPENVFDGDLQAKEAVFFEYGRFDGGVCHSLGQCSANPAYGAYLTRQYQNPF